MAADSTPSPARRRILVLTDEEGAADAIIPHLTAQNDVRIVHHADEALEVLRDDEFDLVVCGNSELLPLARVSNRQRAGSILEGIGQAVCIVNRAGDVVWANAALRGYPPDVLEAARESCKSLLDEWSVLEPKRPDVRVRRRVLKVGDEYTFDTSVSALPNADGRIDEALVLLSDTSEIWRMREKLDAIDAAGRELVALDVDATEQLDVTERLELLEQRLIGYCRELLDFTHFAVLVLDPKTRHLEPVLTGGFSEEAKRVNLYASETDNGISGYVAATGQPYICPDISNDPLYLPGFECANSSLTVPLRLVDRVVGVLNIESDEPAAFSDEDRQVAEIFARYIAVALHTLKLLAVQRSETTGQVTADVAAEISEPLDGIVGDVSRLLEQIPADAPERAPLSSVIERVERIKRAVQMVGETPAIRGLLSEEPTTDPALRGKRVLVADDEDIIRETIADVLTKAGALPFTARDGEEAVAMIHTQAFDLVLSDIKMPNKNGYEVFAAAKERNADTPVILITGFGYDPNHSIVRASREGLAAVLFKPFKVEQLVEAIRKAVETPAP